METLLLVIALNIHTGKVKYFQQQYPTKEACIAAKKKVRTISYRTWRYCI